MKKRLALVEQRLKQVPALLRRRAVVQISPQPAARAPGHQPEQGRAEGAGGKTRRHAQGPARPLRDKARIQALNAKAQ